MMFHSVQFLVLVGLTFAAYWAVTGSKRGAGLGGGARLIVEVLASKRGSIIAVIVMEAAAVGVALWPDDALTPLVRGVAFGLGSVPLFFTLLWRREIDKWARMGVLLFASVLFYAAWKPAPLVLFIGYALVNFVSGQLLERLKAPWARKLVLGLALTWHLGGLFVFKYLDLILRSAGSIAEHFHWPEPPRPLGLLLPVGLSFVAFQAVSYVVDVYRGETSGRFTLFHHLVFKLFFPQVVAGPIVRSQDLMEHIDETPKMTPAEGAMGLFRMAQGIAKKLLLADVMAVSLIDRVYANPANFSSVECVLATVAYTFYIYFDFSAYSDIAIGAAALFGFHFPENFDKPYHGRNLFEFWNRWHISLSTWLRDYLYRPLGGNRGTKYQTLRNTMLVMSFGGLWHGADWKFMLWGGIHGVLLVLTRIKWWVWGKPKYDKWYQLLIGWTWMFIAVVFARVFFRAESTAKALEVFGVMFRFTTSTANVSKLAWGSMAAAVVFYVMPKPVFVKTGEIFVRAPVLVRAAAIVGMGLAIRQIASFETQPYVYFQF
jgi:alginate O-acetyltransferase complex protein AlgI